MNASAARAHVQINQAVYHAPGVERLYVSKQLTPAEIACLLKYQPYFFGRDVLDVGVGTGRTTRYLAPLARRYEALDYSPVMVAYLKRVMPHIRVHQADLADLSAIEEHSFDFVFGPDNVIDALSHEKRMSALAGIARILRPQGIVAFSAHNLHYRRALSPPWLDWSVDPLRLAKNGANFAISWWNHLRIRRMRRTAEEYAILNDRGHRYAVLHYYAARSTVAAQLAAHGLRLLDVFDTDGRALPESADDRDHANLLYVAQA
jgi:SAM-dependent methyltransferase